MAGATITVSLMSVTQSIVDRIMRVTRLDDSSIYIYQQVIDHIRAIPGVSGASLAISVPLSGSWRSAFHVEGQATTGSDLACDYNIVGPRYFESTGIALLKGRDFTEQDGPNSPSVVIVNEEFVRRM